MKESKIAKTEKILKQVAYTPSKSLVVAELLEQLMAVWGGPSKFANAFFTEFCGGKPGGIVRARMLSDVFRLFVSHTSALKGNTTSVEALSDEELRQAVQELTHEAAD